jgi:competence protein ComEA
MRKILGAIAVALMIVFGVPAAGAAKTDSAKAAKKTEKLDLNTASADQLKELPGIGEAYSKKIVDSRPYKAKDELWQRKIIPKATYEKIKDQVVAHQVK